MDALASVKGRDTMGKKIPPLTVVKIKAARVGARLFDGDGLLVTIRPSGLGPYPYASYRYTKPDGRRGELGLGAIDIGTDATRGGTPLDLAKQAKLTEDGRLLASEDGRAKPIDLQPIRVQHAYYRDMVRAGRDPVAEREAERQRVHAVVAVRRVPDFAECLRLYVAKTEAKWTSHRYAAAWSKLVEDHVGKLLPLGVDIITHQQVAEALAPSWLAHPITAKKARAMTAKVIDYAIAQGWRVGDNPAALNRVRDLLPSVPAAKLKVAHFAAADWRVIGTVMQALGAQTATVGAPALQFAILTAARANEVIGMVWGDVDLSPLRQKTYTDTVTGNTHVDWVGARWVIPAAKMKSRKDHRVPLSAWALQILQTMRDLYPDAKPGSVVFPGRDGRSAMSPGSMRESLAAAGFPNLTGHGFRSTFRDWVSEKTAFPPTLAEHALAHTVGSSVERSYARADMFQKRREMMNAWSEFCSAPMVEAEVVRLRPAAVA
jgi:integrase